MSILYIRRFTPGNSWDVWPYHLFRDRYRYYRPSGKFWNFKGRSGFFRSSLHRCFKVTEKTFEFLYSGSGEELKTYDALVINSDYYQVEEINSLFDMGRLEEINTTPKILFVSADYSDWLPREQILSQFDLIFKREVWEDRSRYEIPGNLQSILHPTMLGCPLTNLTKFNLSDFDPKDAGHREPNEQFNRNVFFSGQNSSKFREEVVEKLKNSEVPFEGGLQYKYDPYLKEKHEYPRLSGGEYTEKLRNSGISLCPGGWGKFTYRHLETLYAAGFLLCHKEVLDLDLPLSLEDEKNCATYGSVEEMMERIDFYLHHPEERNEIASRGRKAFETSYDPLKHGTEIRETLSGIAGTGQQ